MTDDTPIKRVVAGAGASLPNPYGLGFEDTDDQLVIAKRNWESVENQRIISDFNNRDEEALINFIESIMQTNLVPGVSVSIVKDQHIVWEKYFGYADIDDEILVDEETLFILSSVSKTITATALMQLWELDLFDLDHNINNYLPFNVNHPDHPLSPISFKMLLSHTSGIKDNWNVMPYYDGDSELELGYYLEEYLTLGGEFYESNSNFTDSMLLTIG